MNLGYQIAQDFIAEANSPIKTIIAIYPGRFQPMGKHHAQVYDWLAKQFGEANTYIATSDKVDPPTSPFNFQEKRSIILKHGINNIVQEKNVYVGIDNIRKNTKIVKDSHKAGKIIRITKKRKKLAKKTT